MPNEINAISLEEAYKTMIVEIEKVKSTKTYQQVRYGINLVFDIYDYFEENYIVIPKNEEIQIGRKIYKLEKFRTELEDREIMVKRLLNDELDDDEYAVEEIE